MKLRRGKSGGPSTPPPPFPSSPLDLPGSGCLSPEERVVLLLASPFPGAGMLEAAMALGSRPSFDWATCLEHARRLWVHPALAQAVLSQDPSLEMRLPTPVRAQLRLATFGARVRWRWCIETLAPVLEAWRARAIRPTLIKGAALQAAWLPPEARLLNDVDIWVPSRRLEEACQVLEEGGFTRSRVDLAAPPGERAPAVARTWVRRQANGLRQLSVDLHHRLLPARVPCGLDAEECVGRGRTVALGDGEVTVFSPEDSVILLGAHLVKDGVVRLQTVADVVTLLEGGASGRRPDFADLAARALATGSAGSTSLALRWGRAGGARVPEGIIHLLEAAAPAARTANAVLVDARALFPRFRMRTVARGALRSFYGPEGGGLLGAWRSTLSGIARADAWLGRTRPATWYHLVRSLPLVPGFLALAVLSRALAGAGRMGSAERVNGLFWRLRER